MSQQKHTPGPWDPKNGTTPKWRVRRNDAGPHGWIVTRHREGEDPQPFRYFATRQEAREYIAKATGGAS